MSRDDGWSVSLQAVSQPVAVARRGTLLAMCCEWSLTPLMVGRRRHRNLACEIGGQ